jgi:glutamate transport system ATP-binding protein
MLKVAGLFKSFKAVEVLKDISFELPVGNIVGLLGASGSGKSTLLRCLSRIETFETGEITFQGHPIHTVSAHEIGLVFQNFQLFPHLTIWKNLTLAPYMVKDADRASIDAKAKELLQNFGLADKVDAHPSQLSGGQKQRIAICRALMMDPALLLFDEPTSALDPGMVNDVGALIQSLKRPDRLIIVATHEMKLAHKITDDVLFMDQGKLLEHKPAKDFFKKPGSDQAKKFLENY